MSDLKGLARSFDALFSATAELSTASPDADSAVATREAAEQAHEEWSAIGSLDEIVGSGDGYSEPDPVDLEEITAEIGPGGHVPAADATEDEDFVPSPLDRAAAEFIAGDVNKAEEIQSLAAECVEHRELGPVARAVASITLAAGDPPDPSIYAVAESIMSPAVLGRLATLIGRERQEEKRTEHYTVCRTIGTGMADAIRDDLAENTDRLARWILCHALVEMGDAGRVAIEEMAVDENRFLVRNAVVMLADLGGDRAVELCTSALANPDARVRKEALRALGKLGDPESGSIVVGLLDDTDPNVRLAAAVTAGELRVKRALKPLVAMLDATKDPDEAGPLIRALGRIADPGAVRSIEKHAVTSLFSRPRTDVRITAYRALNKIGTPYARRLLNQAINDKDARVQAAVKDLLHSR
ncbi:MAG: HEAT repeat domain-containing protein [Longimicrobiales bacterium]|nr:HEAT repeat domain-containing protein [Longimicrobiales bacterium]